MKNLIGLITISLLVGCLANDKIRLRDDRISTLEDYKSETLMKLKLDSIRIDSLETEANKTQRISERRDYWFFEYTAAKRGLDSLYKTWDEKEN